MHRELVAEDRQLTERVLLTDLLEEGDELLLVYGFVICLLQFEAVLRRDGCNRRQCSPVEFVEVDSQVFPPLRPVRLRYCLLRRAELVEVDDEVPSLLGLHHPLTCHNCLFPDPLLQ